MLLRSEKMIWFLLFSTSNAVWGIAMRRNIMIFRYKGNIVFFNEIFFTLYQTLFHVMTIITTLKIIVFQQEI